MISINELVSLRCSFQCEYDMVYEVWKRTMNIQHGDPVISGVESPEKRPSCGYKVKSTKPNAIPGTMEPCGSEDQIFNVKGQGKYGGGHRETPVCRKHLDDAIRDWNYDSADPICPDRGKK